LIAHSCGEILGNFNLKLEGIGSFTRSKAAGKMQDKKEPLYDTVDEKPKTTRPSVPGLWELTHSREEGLEKLCLHSTALGRAIICCSQGEGRNPPGTRRLAIAHSFKKTRIHSFTHCVKEADEGEIRVEPSFVRADERGQTREVQGFWNRATDRP
jgi:hypothetical protein